MNNAKQTTSDDGSAEEWGVYLSQKPLADLRRRQDLCAIQLKEAFRRKDDVAMTRLCKMRDALICAVSYK